MISADYELMTAGLKQEGTVWYLAVKICFPTAFMQLDYMCRFPGQRDKCIRTQKIERYAIVQQMMEQRAFKN